MTLFELAAVLTLDRSGFDQGVAEAENQGKGLGQKLVGFLGTSAKVVGSGLTAAATAVGKLVKSSIDGYADYEQLTGGIQTLYGENSKAAQNMMKNASVAWQSAGMSANEYMETAIASSAALISSLGGDTEKAAQLMDQSIIDMSDNVNKMGTSMEGIQNAYRGFSRGNFTMLDNLALGFAGTKEGMQQLLDKAKEYAAQNGEVRDFSIDSYADIVDAIHIVQTEMGITGTTAREAKDTISGSVGAMKSAWKNLATGLGDSTQDMSVLIDDFVDSAITAVGNIVPRVQVILGGISQLVVKAVDVVGEQLPSILETLIPPLLSAATALFVAVAQAIPELLEIILAQLPTVIETIVAVIPQLAEALLELLPTLLEVGIQIIVSLINGIAQALPDLIPAAVEAITTLLQSFYDNLPLLIEAGLKLLLGLAQGLINAIPQLVAKLPQIINSMVNFFSQSVNKIAEAGVKLLNALVKSLPTIIQTIVAALPQIISSMVQFFTSAIPQLIQAGIDLLVALVKALPTIIKTIVAALPQIIQAITKALTDNIPALMQAGFDLFVALVKNLPAIIKTIVAAIPDIIAGIVNTFGSFLSSMWDIGKSLAEGIWTGLKNAVGWIKEKIKGWVGDVFGFIKRLFGIASPSKLMRDQIGLMLGKGMAEGIEDSLGDVERASEGLMGAIPDIDNRDFSLNVRRNISDSYSAGMNAVVGQIREIMGEFEQTIVLNLNDRELGRAVRGYV